MATHSSSLVWKSPWSLKESDRTECPQIVPIIPSSDFSLTPESYGATLMFIERSEDSVSLRVY